MNRILMEQTLKRLAIPKFQKSKRKDNMWKERSKSLLENDLYNKEKEKNKLKIDLNKKKQKTRSLFEKEKIIIKKKFNFLFRNKFKQLDICEKKFDLVINNTLKILSDYKKSLYYLKK